MTTERPMFPPVNRRGFITQSAIAIATAAVAIGPSAAGAIEADAELVSLGAQFEPLVDRYYAARAIWAPALEKAHAEHEEVYGTSHVYRLNDGTPDERAEVAAHFEAACKRTGTDEACDRLSAIHEEMQPIAEAINALPVTTIAGLRAKALVAFWEISPLCASSTEFSFDDAWPFQQLFAAVAEVCGLTGKIEATGYVLPYIAAVDEGADEDSDDEGETA
jgi:hypothetical protein